MASSSRFADLLEVSSGLPRFHSGYARLSLDGTCTRDPTMNLIIQYGLLGLVLGLGFTLYCSIWRLLALPYMWPQPDYRYFAILTVRLLMTPTSLVPDPVRRPPFYSPPPRVWKRLHPRPLHGPSLTRTN